MTFRTRHRRKSAASPEVQGLFFDKPQNAPAFFNPSHQTDTAAYSTTPVVQRQEMTTGGSKPEEEKPMQKMAMEEEKPVQKQDKKEEDKPVQKQAKEEEKPMQKMAMEEDKPVQKQDKKEEEKPVQKQDNDKEPVQTKGGVHPPSGISEGQQEQTTGVPDRLKAGVENLSGIAIDDVKVHYNSPKPIQMRALAYTQGTNIYLAPGQEKHLPHEVWHVVQQKQGRVTPSLQMKGVGVNDDPSLEHEATVMGNKATTPSSIK